MKNDPKSNIKLIESQFKLANIWSLKGNPEKAIARYQKIIIIQPDYLPAYLELARLMLHRGKNQKAIAFYQKAMDFHPNESCLSQYIEKIIFSSKATEIETKNTFKPTAKSAEKLGHILVYTDCSNVYRVGKFNHSLMVNFFQRIIELPALENILVII